jgi:hypothetical protein
MANIVHFPTQDHAIIAEVELRDIPPPGDVHQLVAVLSRIILATAVRTEESTQKRAA